MTQFNQGNGRAHEQEWSSNAKRIPRMVAYQTKGQLPLTMLAIVVIVAAVFVVWLIKVYKGEPIETTQGLQDHPPVQLHAEQSNRRDAEPAMGRRMEESTRTGNSPTQSHQR